jgi:hypothetical protein
MSHLFEYQTIRLARGREAWARVTRHLFGAGSAEAKARGGSLYGFFQPQLGFASNEGVVVTSWSSSTPQGNAVIAGAGADILSVSAVELSPTLRPVNATPLYAPEKPRGGIYVHRWFTVDAPAFDEFVSLSGAAWESFEKSFDAQIAGLFRAAPTAEDEREGVARLLLLTRYANHGEWEASRNEAADPEAWKRFMRRHELTRETIGRSSLLVASA